MESLLHGFNALSPTAAVNANKRPGESLQKGPMYDVKPEPAETNSADEWPVFRHDAERSCSTKVSVPVELKPSWTVAVGENLSAITVAEGKLFVADKDAHAVYALHSDTGDTAWKYTAGARVDSPPAVAMGRVLFGSRDGFLYCLHAADGRLAWRYRVAPDDKYLMADNQLESVWPLHGSPLVVDDRVYTVAGRSMFLDTGLRFVCLDIPTGKEIHEEVLDHTDPLTGGKLQDKISDRSMPPANPDILSYSGRNIFMNMQKFNMDGSRPEIQAVRNAADQQGEDAHLFVNGGFLDDTGFHRILMLYGKVFTGGASSNHAAPKHAPGGKMLAFNDEHVFGFSRLPHLHKWVRALEWHIYRAGKPGGSEPTARKAETGKSTGRRRAVNSAVNYEWSSRNPDLYVNSIVLTGERLFVAGPPAVRNETTVDALEKWEGKRGGMLWVLSTDDGQKLSEVKLASPPVHEGMAAAYGKLFAALKDGSVVCLE
jgi:outer membrane protein assembly factor BamB